MEADYLRVAAMLLGGISFGMAVPVLRAVVRNADNGCDRLAAKLFGCVHLVIVLFVWGVLVSRFGIDESSWRVPAALVIFTLKIALFMVLRECQRTRLVLEERRSP